MSGLDPQVTEQIIRDHFAPFGHVLAVKLPINHETGRQRDLALITMDSGVAYDHGQACEGDLRRSEGKM